MSKLNYITGFVLLSYILSGCHKEVVQKVEDFGVVINEIMPANSDVVADQNGEYDDWVELYNKLDTIVDISGYYLTDSKNDLSKWKFPSGTTILPDSFLIVWADNDTLQQGTPLNVYGLHANYKLSSGGETVIFLNPEMIELDRVKYDSIDVQNSFARIPDGTGEFSWQEFPTFNGKNVQNQ